MGVFSFPSKLSVRRNGISALSLSKQAVLSKASWSRGAEGFEMQSSGDPSPTLGSSSVTKLGTQACFPSPVVIPTSYGHTALYTLANLSKSFTLGHGR